MKTIQEVAKAMLNDMEYKKINEERSIYTCNNPKWRSIIRECHAGMFPDDYKYEFIIKALEAIIDCNDIMLGFDISTNDLTTWLNSNVTRVEYISEALSESGAKTGFDLLSFAQYVEKQEVFNILRFQLECLIEE